MALVSAFALDAFAGIVKEVAKQMSGLREEEVVQKAVGVSLVQGWVIERMFW